MKKTTLKIFVFLFIAMSFQGQAQIVEGTKYNLRNFGTGDYLKADGNGNYEFSATLPTDDVTFNFIFDHYNDGTLSFPGDWNIGNDVRGIMRGAGTGATVHTNFQFDDPNSNGGQKTDKRWIESSVEQSGFTTYRFEIASGGDERFLYQGTDGVLYNITVADMNDEAISYTDGEARSYWLLAESTIVLSNTEFDASLIFVSNPVKNMLTIKGLTNNVKQVSVFSLIGNEVKTQEVNGAESLNIDISTLASGMYILDFKGVNGSFTKKIVKQ